MTRVTKKSIEPLIECIDATGEFPDDKGKRVFTDICQHSINGTRPHSQDESYTQMPWVYVRDLGQKLRGMNEPLGFPFIFLDHDVSKRTATGFKLRPDIIVNLGDLEGETPISVDTGRKIRRQKHAVAFKDSRGSRSTFKLDILQDIHVDRKGLHRIVLEGDKIESENASSILRQSPDGIFRQQYQENGSGRLFGKGINLQNIKSSVRRMALPSGSIEFDIENCHGMALNWLATSLGYKTGILQTYAKDPVSIRKALAEDIGIEYDDAKTLILMSIYWSGINSGIKKAVIDSGGNPDALQGLFKALWKDIRGAGRHVIEHGERSSNGHRNALGKDMALGSPPAQVLNHYLTGIERQVLDIGVSGAEGVLLLEHDGFSAMGGDPEMFSDMVVRQTGIPAKFTIKSVKN